MSIKECGRPARQSCPSPCHAAPPARIPLVTPSLTKRLLLLGAALAAAATAAAAVTDLSGSLASPLDTVVGAGNSGRLTANTTTKYDGTTASSNVNLNGFELNLYNGGGNVDHLIVDGVEQPKGAYTVSSGWVLGSGYIDVQNFARR